METLIEQYQQLQKIRMRKPYNPPEENKKLNKTQRNVHRLFGLQRVNPARNLQIHHSVSDQHRKPTMARKHPPVLNSGDHYGVLH